MAKRWNDIKNIRTTRNQALSGVPPAVPSDFTDLPDVSKIKNTAPESPIEWRVVGVSPVAVDFDGKQIAPLRGGDPFPARVRPEGFAKVYQDLDSLLDAGIISVQGLTFEIEQDHWRS